MSLDPTKRIQNWDAGYDTAAIKAKVDKKRPEMLARVSAVFPQLASVELRVKQVLDTIIQVPFYMSFGRELWSLSNKDINGETGSQEASVLIAKWTGRGLTQSVLENIRDGIFKIARPTTP
jgi:hypothetical protein